MQATAMIGDGVQNTRSIILTTPVPRRPKTASDHARRRYGCIPSRMTCLCILYTSNPKNRLLENRKHN
jgi:hypothetical protein